MSKRRAVADTNVMLSSLLAYGSLSGVALRHLITNYELLASKETLFELQDVVMRDKFAKISKTTRQSLLGDISSVANMIAPHISIKACRDPKDDKFLSLAVSGNAALILTGDKDLLALHPFQNIEIISPTTYLDRYTR